MAPQALRIFVPLFPADDYVLLVNNIGGTSTLEMYITAYETLLQMSKIPPTAFKSLRILTNFVEI